MDTGGKRNMSTNDANPYKSPESREFGGSVNTADLSYHVVCACGQRTSVSKSAAGGTVSCSQCGKDIEVPTLSQLRMLAGKGAYEAGIADTVRRTVSSGELPKGNLCQLSGRPTENITTVYVQCEEKWKRAKESNKSYIPLFVLGILSLPYYLMRICTSKFDVETEVLGHDVIVPAPLRVHPDSCRELNRASQRKLRRILRTVPAYEELLNEYPRAKIIVKD
jgi:hypothetical protein